MSDVVHVRHWAPIRHVPAGKRKEASAYAPVRSPVRLREAEARDFTAVARLPSKGDHPLELFAHEGALWHPLMGVLAWDRRLPLPRTSFLAVLQGEDYPERGEACPFRLALHQTPFKAHGAAPLLAGEAPDGTVTWSGEGQAASDLARWLDTHVRLVGDAAFIRFPGPFVTPTCRGELLAKARSADAGLHLLRYPRFEMEVGTAEDFLCRIDRLAGLRAHKLGLDSPEEEVGWLLSRQARELDPALFQDDDDLAFMANHAAVRAMTEMQGVLRRVDAGTASAIRDTSTALEPYTLRAMTGALPAEEALDTLEQAVRAIRRVRELAGPQRTRTLAAMGDLLEGYGLPLARSLQALAAEDLDVLADAASVSTGMAP